MFHATLLECLDSQKGIINLVVAVGMVDGSQKLGLYEHIWKIASVTALNVTFENPY